MRIKRFISSLLVVSVIAALFGFSSVFAMEPSGSWNTDWKIYYMNLKNEDHNKFYNPMYAYYNYGSPLHDAWCSTEVSVSTNGTGYAFAEINDWDGNLYASSTGKLIAPTDGWVKLKAVYGDVNGAKYVRFAGKQKVGSNLVEKRVHWINNKK